MNIWYILKNKQGITTKVNCQKRAEMLTRHGWYIYGQYRDKQYL